MRPNPVFLALPRSFWANVRSISETVGYTERGKGAVKVPSLPEMAAAMHARNLKSSHLLRGETKPTKLGRQLCEYFAWRARMLNEYIEPRLMTAQRARAEYAKLKAALCPGPDCPFPMNKQKGKKKVPAYLTCMVNMIINAHAREFGCDFDPHALTTVTRNGAPVRTLARRVDGAFPSTVNPIAVWEIKEYYHTTTFGSRVADGVYESLLDGMELEELHEHERIKVLHYMIIDAHFTWWRCGRSYLCRIVDAMHMGYIDEVLFGYEVIERLPGIVQEWMEIARSREQ